METITVILADDHPVVRSVVRKILERTKEIVVVGEAETGLQTIQLVQELKPTLVLLDIELPDIKGYEVAQRLKELNPPVSILALSAYSDRQYVVKMLSSGAAGYLTKDETPARLIQAVKSVAQGQRGWLSPSVLKSMNFLQAGKLIASETLNKDDKEMLRWLASGKTDTEISLLLGINLTSARSSIQALVHKLGANSRTEAILYALREGILSQ